MDDNVCELGVVLHPLLDQAGEGREHQGPVDALLVHQLDPWRRLAIGRDRADRGAEDLPPALAIGIAVAVEVLHGARCGHHVERRVGDVLADMPPDHDLGAASHVDVVDGPLVPVGQKLGQRVRVSYRWLSASKTG